MLLTHSQLLRLYRLLYPSFSTKFLNRIIEQDQREPAQMEFTLSLLRGQQL